MFVKGIIILEIIAGTIGGWMFVFPSEAEAPIIVEIEPVPIIKEVEEQPIEIVIYREEQKIEPEHSPIVEEPETILLEPDIVIKETIPIQEPIQIPIYIPIIEHQTTPVPAPQQEQPEQTLPVEQISMKSITIIDPIKGKGRGRVYKESEEVVDESNYIELGLVVRNGDGDVVKDVLVKISATDLEEDKKIKGTGNITKIHEDGNTETVHYYPFRYEFKTAGTHTITFKALGVTEVLELEVGEPAE